MHFIICTNAETLTAGTALEGIDHIDAQAVVDAVKTLVYKIDQADFNCDSFFAHWHGGKYDQAYKRIGFVAFSRSASPEVEAVADRIDDAIKAEIERQEREFAADQEEAAQ
jgi:hypothetical protein